MRVLAKLIDLAPIHFEEFDVTMYLSLDLTPRTGASSCWNLPRFFKEMIDTNIFKLIIFLTFSTVTASGRTIRFRKA